MKKHGSICGHEMNGITIWTETITVGELIGEDHEVSVFDAEEPMSKVFAAFTEKTCEAAVVCRDDSVIGVVTTTDLLRGMKVPDNMAAPIGTFVSASPLLVSDSETLEYLLRRLEESPVHKIVVAGEDRNVLGMIDSRCILATYYQQFAPLIKRYGDNIRCLIRIAGDDCEGLLEMATTDPLTGIANRRLLNEIFQSHAAVSRRYAKNLFVLIFDIDNFKEINDGYGHNVGDKVLKELVEVVRKRLRGSDSFARWGGEEFVVLMHADSYVATMTLAEQLRRGIAMHDFGIVERLTCSFGVAKVRPSDELDDVIDRADVALYTAKRKGKNTIVYGWERT